MPALLHRGIEFPKNKFRNMLPFVVITDSKGKALASYSGYKVRAALTAIIEGASPAPSPRKPPQKKAAVKLRASRAKTADEML